MAKAFHDEPALSDDASQSPTVTKGTALGVILGTASYMSPEQARGKPLDKRTDLWAFGCCLYESLVGRKTFVGETTTDTLAAIVNAEPSWAALPVATPTSVRRLLRRCLAKSVRRRLADASTARLELEESDAPETAAAVSARSGKLTIALWVSGIVVAAVFAMSQLFRNPPQQQVRRVAVSTSDDSTKVVSTNTTTAVDISPDGNWIAYIAHAATSPAGDGQLYLREIADFAAKPVGDAGAAHPRFSPDSHWLGYYNTRDGAIMRVATGGSSPELVCETTGEQRFGGFDWSGERSVVFSGRTGGLFRCDGGGRGAEKITTVASDRGEFSHSGPRVLPGGDIVFQSWTAAGGEGSLAVVSEEGGGHQLLDVAGTSPLYLSSGYLVYGTEGGLRAIEFDLEKLDVVGESFPLLTGVNTNLESADFAVSDDGSLLYVPGVFLPGRSSNRSLVWVDRNGQTTPVIAERMAYSRLQISPSGDRVALEVRATSADVWVWDFERETMTRTTFDLAVDGYPVWTSDERIVFESHRVPQGNVFEKAADGTGTATRLADSPDHHVPLSASPDGKWIVFEERIGGGADRDLVLYSRETGRTAPLIATTTFQETGAAISPDGRWVAYSSDEAGQNNVYVRPFPNVDDGKWPISSAGGSHPVWSRDGRELFFLDATRHLSVVDVRAEAEFDASRPARILERSFFLSDNDALAYDVSTDGVRFLTIEEDRDIVAPTEMHLVLNWLNEFERFAAAVQ